MRATPSRRLRTSLVLAAAAVATAACSSDPGDDDAYRDVDPRAYYDDYASTDEDHAASSGSGAAPGAVAQEVEPGPVPVPGPTEDNVFVDAGTSGFVPAAEDPESTFALDVDTGSYGVARTLLRDGHRPPPESVRVEEWVNAMDYDDPAPTEGDLGVTAETGAAPGLDDGTQVVRVGVAAREVDLADRPRVNVTLVVDRSGSMDIRERLGLVQSSLALLAYSLDVEDTVSVVSFEDEARPILEPTPVGDTERIVDAIDDLTPGGSTNLAAGVELGYEQARNAYDDDRVNLVVLCSDGVANVGTTGPEAITDLIAEQGARGIHLVTVGYGMGNYNDHLMEQLADLGDGFYAYVDTFAEAERLFRDDLTTALAPVAAEARAQVTFDPGLVEDYRLVGYDNRAIADEDFDDMEVDAGELGAGHRATALYEVRLADGVPPGTTIGEATVRWTGVDDGGTHEARTSLVAADPGATPSRDLALATTAADLAGYLKGASPYAERDLSLPDLAARADELDAEELADLVEQVGAAR